MRSVQRLAYDYNSDSVAEARWDGGPSYIVAIDIARTRVPFNIWHSSVSHSEKLDRSFKTRPRPFLFVTMEET